MFDALDTLWIMDLKPEFERALNHISKAEFHRHRVGSLTQPSIII